MKSSFCDTSIVPQLLSFGNFLILTCTIYILAPMIGTAIMGIDDILHVEAPLLDWEYRWKAAADDEAFGEFDLAVLTLLWGQDLR